jgi:hypothetical protein
MLQESSRSSLVPCSHKCRDLGKDFVLGHAVFIRCCFVRLNYKLIHVNIMGNMTQECELRTYSISLINHDLSVLPHAVLLAISDRSLPTFYFLQHHCLTVIFPESQNRWVPPLSGLDARERRV